MADLIHDMRRMVLLLGLTLIFVPGLFAQDEAPSPPSPAPSDAASAAASSDSIPFQDFYDSLARQGTWIQSSDYGYVWH